MCTRVVYSGKNGMVVTGRSMDWKTEMHSNLWVFPKGMERNGETGANSLQWTSKYGSVVTSAFEIASTDGMNEKGLVANLLWLPETEYPVRDQSKPGLAITAWVQYMLDNFATVDEAVAFIDENTFQVVSDLMPDGSRLATLHLSISDATGDCAIFEYTGGKLTVYHSKEYKVMTTITVNVTGMMCGHCEAHVTKAVKEAFGVEDVVSSHEKGTTVIHAPEKLDEDKIREVIKEAGYEVTGITQE